MKIYNAEGTVRTKRFVTMDGVAADFTVKEAVADDFPYGISADYGNQAPLPTATDPIPAATDGQPIEVIRATDPENATAMLELGGTVSPGDRLMPTANGVAIVATTGKYYGAIADEGGASGEMIRVTPCSGLEA